MKNREAPKWLKRREILGEFGRYERQAQQAFHAFVSQEPPKDSEKRLGSLNWPAVLGSDRFKDWVKEKYLGSRLDQRRVPQLRALLREKGIGDLAKLIAGIEGCDEGEIRKVRRGWRNAGRRAFVYAGREYLRLAAREIGEYLGVKSYSAISKQHRLAQEEMDKKSGCYALIGKIAKALKCQVKT